MARSEEKSVDAYLKSLPAERRAVVKTLRELVLENLPKGYEESFEWGYPTYEIPLAKYPDTYNKRPLCYAGIAAQKNHYAVYLMCVYQDAKLRKQLEDDFAKAGKKLDMGKSCVRFKKLEDVPLPAIARAIRAVTPGKYIAAYEKLKGKA
jgi:uncharacterized protein YdhG (YjbR/CyaY superfamily)